MLVQEQWLPIPGWPEYEASSLGRVRSSHRGRLRILKPWTNANGYLYLRLCAGGSRQSRTVHSLIAETFHGPIAGGQVVRHLDGSRQHNVPSNLAIGSASENNHDSVRHGTHGMANRTHCPRGHEYTAENTRVHQGRRFCKTCKGWRTVEQRRQRGLLLIVGRDPFKPCPQGHEWTPENTYISPQGVRFCRPCAKDRSRAFQQARRAAGIAA